MQYVKIDLGSTRAYTYAWAGETPLEVGDWVVVPGNSFQPNPSTGKVLRVLPKCDFTGKVTILRQRIDMARPTQVSVKDVVGQRWGVDDNVLGQESGPIGPPMEYVETEDDIYDEGHAQGQD